MHEGNLLIEAGEGTDGLKCVTRVTGDVTIHGDVDAAELAGLVDLQQVDGDLMISDNALLADLAPLACLKAVNSRLLLSFLPALSDLSGLSGLEVVRHFHLRATGVAGLGGLPALKGVAGIDLFDNPVLVDLEALAGWEIAADEFVVQVGGNPLMTDLGGFAGPLTQAGPEVGVAVQVFDSPGLTSLAGLEGLTHGHLTLSGLPLLADLEPLAQFTAAGSVSLSGLPLVSTLHGLHNLESVVGILAIGECANGGPDSPGMDALVDLTGLDALTVVAAFGLANNEALVGLGGAPKLKGVNWLEAVGNPKLTPGAFAEFVAQLDAPPDEQCHGDWNQCSCFQILPW